MIEPLIDSGKLLAKSCWYMPPPRLPDQSLWLPLTVLWVSVTAAGGENPAAVGDTPRGAVAADGALGERHGASAQIPPP